MTTLTMPQAKKETKYNFVDNPLNILVSCRVRLTEEQRQILKTAYHKLRFGDNTQKKTHLAGSSVTSSTIVESGAIAEFYRTTRCSAVVIGDILGSRESISLPVILSIQRGLGVTAITKEDCLKACEGYCEYVFTEMDLG